MSSLWLYAVFVSATDAAELGWAYLALRSTYPVVWAVFGGESGMPANASMLTSPQYAINVYEVISVILKVGYDMDLAEMFFGYKAPGYVRNVAPPVRPTRPSAGSGGAMQPKPMQGRPCARPASPISWMKESWPSMGALFRTQTLGVFVFNIAYMMYAMAVIGTLSTTVFAGFFKAKK